MTFMSMISVCKTPSSFPFSLSLFLWLTLLFIHICINAALLELIFSLFSWAAMSERHTHTQKKTTAGKLLLKGKYNERMSECDWMTVNKPVFMELMLAWTYWPRHQSSKVTPCSSWDLFAAPSGPKGDSCIYISLQSNHHHLTSEWLSLRGRCCIRINTFS